MKAKPTKVKKSPGSKSTFSVDLRRMNAFLDQTRDSFVARVDLTKISNPKFTGTLAGPVAKRRTDKS